MNPVESLLANFKSALAEKNVDALVDLYDEDILLFDTWDQWSMAGKGIWRSLVEGWFGSLGSESVTADFEIVQELASETLISLAAFVTFTAVSAEGEKLRSNKERITWILVLKAEGWKISHAHNSIPAEMK